MKIDDSQAAVVFAILAEIDRAIKAGDATEAQRLCQGARDVMTNIPVSNKGTS